MSMRRIVGIVGSVLLLAACESGVALEGVPAEAAEVYCTAAETCLGRLADRFQGGAQCRVDVEGGFANAQLERWQAIVDAGTATYDPAVASVCLSELSELGCDIFIAAPPSACREMFRGTVALGEACSLSEECEGDAYCEGAGCPDVPGTCTARKANGSECDNADECQDGLLCEEGVCRAPGSASGGVCGGSSGLGCPLGETCVGADADTPGTCTPNSEVFAGAEGDACDLRVLDLCSPELSCAVTGRTGTEPDMSCVTIASSGGSCFAAVPEMCPLGEYCDAQPFMGVFEGTCVSAPDEGEPCGTSATGGSVCAPGLDCVTIEDTRTCVRLRDNGASCSVDQECFSGNCDGGTCAALPLCG